VTMLLKFTYEFPNARPARPRLRPRIHAPLLLLPHNPRRASTRAHRSFGPIRSFDFPIMYTPSSVQNRCLGIKEVRGNHVMEAGSKKNLARAIGPLELGGP
jgi:hypothetical protein